MCSGTRWSLVRYPPSPQPTLALKHSHFQQVPDIVGSSDLAEGVGGCLEPEAYAAANRDLIYTRGGRREAADGHVRYSDWQVHLPCITLDERQLWSCLLPSFLPLFIPHYQVHVLCCQAWEVTRALALISGT